MLLLLLLALLARPAPACPSQACPPPANPQRPAGSTALALIGRGRWIRPWLRPPPLPFQEDAEGTVRRAGPGSNPSLMQHESQVAWLILLAEVACCWLAGGRCQPAAARCLRLLQGNAEPTSARSPSANNGTAHAAGSSPSHHTHTTTSPSRKTGRTHHPRLWGHWADHSRCCPQSST